MKKGKDTVGKWLPHRKKGGKRGKREKIKSLLCKGELFCLRSFSLADAVLDLVRLGNISKV